MTITKRKLRSMGESLRVYITKAQERTILDRFGCEPKPYEWTEEDIFIQIRNFLGCGEFVKTIQDNSGQLRNNPSYLYLLSSDVEF